MEPRPHERGKQHKLEQFQGLYRASMEPRPHERGKFVYRLTASPSAALQWSHVLTNVERTRQH